jgi:superfamily II DNA or RNA helicase
MEAVILLRPTQSLTLYIQQSMRAMRPDKYNPFKTAIILDHVGNVQRHGLPDAQREWSLEGVVKRKKSESAGVGVRQCLQCYGCHSPAPVCPYCGYVYNLTPRQLAQEAGELKEYDARIAALEKKKARMTVGMARTIADLEEIAKERGYKSAWVKIQAKLKHIRS